MICWHEGEGMLVAASALAVIVGVCAAVQILGIAYLKAVVESAARHRYDCRREEYRRELDRRERAAVIAEMFAEWASERPDYAKLNRLNWECALWLPANVVRAIQKRLSNAGGALEVKEILVAVRGLLRGEDDDLKAGELVHFPRH
jgi:hypothetical protein